MAQKDTTTIPEGFTVACVEGRWYPLEVYKLYTSRYPNGFMTFNKFYTSDGSDQSFRLRRDAVNICQMWAFEQNYKEQRSWEQVAYESDVYPERCIHYRDLIQQVTGMEPTIIRCAYEVHVMVPAHWCMTCEDFRSSVSVAALTIEDALEEAAQQVYANRCMCERVQELHLQLIA